MRSRVEILTNDIQNQLNLIDQLQRRASEHRIEAGQALLLLRKWVEAGEAGAETSWWEYYGEHFTRSRRDAERLMKIARSDDPAAEAELERKYNAQQAFAHRLRKAQEDRDLRQSQAKPPVRISTFAVKDVKSKPFRIVAETPEPVRVGGRISFVPPEEKVVSVSVVYDVIQECLDLVQKMNAEQYREFYGQLPPPEEFGDIEMTLARRRH